MLRLLWTAKKKSERKKKTNLIPQITIYFIFFFIISEIQFNVLFSCHCHVTLIYTSGIWHCTMFE